MSIHRGSSYHEGSVTIGAPSAAHTLLFLRTDAWLATAPARDDVYYFVICEEQRPVGHILLHDMDPATGEALIAYAVADPADRGRGLGTKALGLLQRFVREATKVQRLIIITSRDNAASQRIAVTCGFRHTGASREDPINGVVFEWVVQR